MQRKTNWSETQHKETFLSIFSSFFHKYTWHSLRVFLGEAIKAAIWDFPFS